MFGGSVNVDDDRKNNRSSTKSKEQYRYMEETDGLLVGTNCNKYYSHGDAELATAGGYEDDIQHRWKSSGVGWKDFFHFVGPGWFVCIAYVDPGNYQADIQAGATSRYRLLWTIWWASILSIYIQSLCVRLGKYV